MLCSGIRIQLDLLLRVPTIGSMPDGDRFEPNVALLKEHNEMEWRRMMSWYNPRICSFIRAKFNVPLSELEDICQEAMLGAAKSITNFRDGATFSTWLFGIAHKKGVDWIRKRGRSALAASDSLDTADEEDRPVKELPANTPTPGESAVRSDEADCLRQVIADLGDTCRDVIVMFYERQLKNDQIATELGLALPTITARLSKCRKRMKGMFESMMRRDPGNSDANNGATHD